MPALNLFPCGQQPWRSRALAVIKADGYGHGYAAWCAPCRMLTALPWLSTWKTPLPCASREKSDR